jgi:hypothetical protein
MLQHIDSLFPEATLDDLRLYLNDTVVLTQDYKTERFPVLRAVSGIDLTSSGNKRYFTLRSYGDTPAKVALTEDKVLFELWFPVEGWCNHRKGAVHISRIPLRQNKKGICSGTMESFGLTSAVRGLLGFKHVIPSFWSAYAFEGSVADWTILLSRNDRFWSLSHGLSKMDNDPNVFGFALSPQFAVSLGVASSLRSIWFKDIPSGQIINEGRIAVTEPLLRQEYIDYFTPQGITVEA